MPEELVAIQAKLSSAKRITILVPVSPEIDVMAASLSLYLSLSELGKTVEIYCPSKAIVRDSHLVGIDQLKEHPVGQNLTLTINVEGDVVDKVTSNLVDGKLSLTIIPKDGTKPLTKEDILFGTTGPLSDLYILMGASKLDDFGSILKAMLPTQNSNTLVNLTNKPSNFGSFNLVDPGCSLSELTVAIIKELSLPLSVDAASNLLLGIRVATNSFQSADMTADTFEALAVLYRAGAKYQAVVEQRVATIIDNTPIIEERQKEDEADIRAIEQELASMTDVAGNEPVNEDWLKPKIFKSSSDK